MEFHARVYIFPCMHLAACAYAVIIDYGGQGTPREGREDEGRGEGARREWRGGGSGSHGEWIAIVCIILYNTVHERYGKFMKCT
jgi:hypothetical protein